MQIDIETREVFLPKNTRDGLKSKISKRVGRLANRLLYLRVTLADDNGPRGGRDKICRLVAGLRRGGQIVVTHRSRSVAAALVRGLYRLRRLLAKQRRFTRAARRNGSRVEQTGLALPA